MGEDCVPGTIGGRHKGGVIEYVHRETNVSVDSYNQFQQYLETHMYICCYFLKSNVKRVKIKIVRFYALYLEHARC